MFNWREVRSESDLKEFIIEYKCMSPLKRTVVRNEMTEALETMKLLQHATWFKKPRQVEKPSRRVRRPRTARVVRRG